MNTPIYFTLPKTKEAKYTVFRTGTIRHVKKKPEPKTEAKPERKARPEQAPEHPLASGNMTPGSPDVPFHGEHELAPVRARAARTAVASKKSAAAINKGAIKGAVRQAAQPKKPAADFNWGPVQAAYTKSKVSADQIASRFGIPVATLKWQAGKQKWHRPHGTAV
jgi:hypothetical protein